VTAKRTGQRWRVALALVIGCIAASLAQAETPLTLVLNWVPSADHAPFYYAEQQGWYREAGIDLTIDSATGSPEAIKRALNEPGTLAVADFVSFVRTRDARTPATAIMALQPRSPYAVYFRAGTGIERPADLAGKRIAAMDQDPMRSLWLELARRNGIDPSQTRWVPLSNAQKPDALEAAEVDAALNPFLHNHLNYEAALGPRMRVFWWHQLGFPAPGHVLVASGTSIEAKADAVRRFVGVSQRAWQACLARAAACVNALIEANPQLDRDRERRLFELGQALHSPAGEPGVVGAFDPRTAGQASRFVADVLRVPPLPEAALSNAFLDPATVR
jgi:NitT/TauT family transport system substrate-binding protein